jgi:uncharacterized protein (TIGR03118 family)
VLGQTFRQVFLLISDDDVPTVPSDTGFISPMGMTYDTQASAAADPFTEIFWVAVNGTNQDLVQITPSSVKQLNYVATETGGVVTELQTIYGTGPVGFDPVFTNLCVLSTGNTGFVFQSAGTTGPAYLIASDRHGCIYAYNSLVNSRLVPVINNTASGACYYSCETISDNVLYAPNFASGLIEVYNNHFQLVSTFTDPSSFLVNTALYHPFSIHYDAGLLFVTFVKNNNNDNSPLVGNGNGIVNIFLPDGTFVSHFQAAGYINVPYGLAIVPLTTSPSGITELWTSNFGNGFIQRTSLTGQEFPLVQTLSRDVMNTPFMWDILYLPKASTIPGGNLQVMVSEALTEGNSGVLKTLVAAPPDNIP